MRSRKIEFIVVATLIILAAIVKNISYKSFLDYKDTILNQQSRHILTIAKSAAKNLEYHIDERRKAVGSLAANLSLLMEEEEGRERFVSEEFRLFKEYRMKEAEALFYIDGEGKKYLAYPDNEVKLNKEVLKRAFNQVKESRQPYIIRGEERKRIDLYICHPLIHKGVFQGVIICEINLKTLYKEFIKPVSIAKGGYLMVKDSRGVVLMHPSDEKISTDILNMNEKIYPDLERSEVENLLDRQLSGRAGTYIGDSEWNLKGSDGRKMYGFAPVSLGEDMWIVSLIMPYDEIDDLLKGYFYSSSIISFIVIISFVWVLKLAAQMIKNKETYRIERSYLKELNRTSEELREKEAELYHKKNIEIIGALTGGIAQEFNNILMPIKSHSESILEKLDPERDEDLYEDVEIIYESSKRSQKIIDQILPVNSQRDRSLDEVVSLNKLLRDIKRVAESVIPSDVELRIEEVSEEIFVSGSEDQLHQVVLNLIKNGINAMKESSKKILIAEVDEVQEKEGRMGRVRISDTGCGMEEETLEKIFTPFYTKKLSKDSTGLGLYVATEIVKKHRGRIEVVSVLGEGSTFEIILPSTDKTEEEETQG